jgi:uncharacterized membrane protein YhaH (DUF805 family)
MSFVLLGAFIVLIWIAAPLMVRRFRGSDNALTLSLCSITALALFAPAGPLLFTCAVFTTTVFLAVVGAMAALGV